MHVRIYICICICICIYIYMCECKCYVRECPVHTHYYARPPPPCTYQFFGLRPKTVRCVFAVLFRSRKPKQHTAIKDDSPKPKKAKKTKKSKPKKTKKNKKNIISELSHLCIFLRLFWKSSEIMFFLILFFSDFSVLVFLVSDDDRINCDDALRRIGYLIDS